MSNRLRRLPVVLSGVLGALLCASGPSALAGSHVATTAAPDAARPVIVTGVPATVRRTARQLSATDGFHRLPVIHGYAADLTSAQVRDLTGQGLHVTADARVSVSDADWGSGSHDAAAVYPTVDGAPSAWASGLDGHGVGVAVIDTGISTSGDLAGRVIDGYDFSGEGSATTDSFGHGTFVAGTIAGSGAASGHAIEGVAPGVDLISLKVAGANGSSDVIRVITAIQWAVNHAAKDNIRVLNLSLGTDSTQSWRIDPLDAAVEGAWRSGMVVTVAAGNGGAAGISKPGDDPYVVTVGATDDATTPTTSDDTVAPFSSTGPTATGVAKPDLVAPGAHVVSSRAPGSTVDNQFPAARIDPSYFRGSGTSFSAPQVAGAAALLLQQRPDLTNNQVKALLVGTASALPGVPATAQGAGELDINALIAAPTGGSANQGLGRSDGSGSAVGSEGSLVAAGSPSSGDSVAWNSSAWNSSAWSSSAWNSAAWNSSAWNSSAWNSSAWNSSAWNSTAWNSTAWNAGGWASASFWSTAWN
ncbi:MAG TPA: S8 family serine peptidase [Nocardioides sp.]|nr:S8 family serine peptidase [Nocardioides sp.]